jgi:predicted O-methyltransferase YrrM
MATTTELYMRLIRAQFAALPDSPNHEELMQLLRLMARWRSDLLANTYVQHHGARIMHGPFAGMEYLGEPSEGPLMPRLLGAYEQELHPHLSRFREEGVDCVIDIGCAEGYYAVGLARAWPDVTVYAYDIDANARAKCAVIAERNGVSDRVIIGAEFKPQDFENFAGRNPLVIVDTEGAEVDLLQPQLSPALAQMRLIVETHDVFRPGALNTMKARFAPTHEIEQVDIGLRDVELPQWLKQLAPLDHVLSIWEWRLKPTPWLVMRPKGN